MTLSSNLAISAEPIRSSQKPVSTYVRAGHGASPHGRPGRCPRPEPAGAQWVLWQASAVPGDDPGNPRGDLQGGDGGPAGGKTGEDLRMSNGNYFGSEGFGSSPFDD